MMGTIDIAHFINLAAAGGLERHYSAFINYQNSVRPVLNHTILTQDGLAPPIKPSILEGSASLHCVKRAGTVKIPRWPSALRYIHRNRILSKINPDIIMLWSNPTAVDLHRLRTAARIFYYEHGAVWFDRKFKGLHRQFEKIDGIICNSLASKRMIQLHWGIRDDIPINVCLNAVRPDCVPTSPQPKTYRNDRPFRLGIAGRLEPVKGFLLALHAVKLLLDKKVACELHIAGTGSELTNMTTLAKKLNMEQHVNFKGFVQDMIPFFTHIDCLLCTSLHESFGLVCVEAMHCGCPVIASGVDGLPEVVDHFRTGFCLSPTLPIHHYKDLGGTLDNMPRIVYNPDSDCVESPKVVDPGSFAEAIETLMSDAVAFNQMSRVAISTAQKKFDFSRHVDDVLQSLNHKRQLKEGLNTADAKPSA